MHLPSMTSVKKILDSLTVNGFAVVEPCVNEYFNIFQNL